MLRVSCMHVCTIWVYTVDVHTCIQYMHAYNYVATHMQMFLFIGFITVLIFSD